MVYRQGFFQGYRLVIQGYIGVRDRHHTEVIQGL